MMTELTLLRPADVPLAQARVFRVSGTALASIAIVLGLIVAAFCWIGWRGTVRAVIAGWVVFWLGFFALLYANDWRKALSPDAWLAALTADRLYVKFRSYRNLSWSDADPQVVFVPYSAIASARSHRRTWLTSERRSGAVRREPVTYIQIALTGVDTTALAESLAAERAGKPGRKPGGTTIWRHFPVSIEPGDILRIEWRARPHAAAFLDALAAHGVAIETRLSTTADVRRPDREQLEELARRGNMIEL